MTLKELLDIVLLDTDEDATDLEMVDRFINYINRAYKELAVREQLEKASIKTVVDRYITMPVDLIEIKEVRDGYDVVNYITEGKKIKIDSDLDEVKLIYSYIPEKLINDTDEFETNEANSEFIVNYVKWLYFFNDGLLEEANLYRSEFESVRIVKNSVGNNTVINMYGGLM